MSTQSSLLLRSLLLPAALFAGTGTAGAGDDHRHSHGSDDHGHAHREHGAHVHGVAELNVAVDADTLLIELDTPAHNLVGFEHAPRTDAQRAAVTEARKTLEDGIALFAPSAAAECVQISNAANLNLDAADDQQLPDEEIHADAHAEWAFTCAKPAALTQLDVKLFDVFPGKDKLRVQLVTPNGQRGAELTPSRHQLDL